MKRILIFAKRNWVFVVISITVIVIIILMINKSKEENNLPVLDSGIPNPIFPLIEGSKGVEVSNLQKYLNSQGSSLTVDGIFGPLTLVQVQRVFGRMLVSQIEYQDIILKNI